MEKRAATYDDSALADVAVAMVSDWLTRAHARSARQDRRVAARLASLMTDIEAVAFTMRFVDRVARPENNAAAAHQLAVLVGDHRLPRFLAPGDRLLLWFGAKLAPLLPGIVMPLARARMRGLVGHLVADAAPERLTAHLGANRSAGYAMNVNLLGEAILGEREAARRFERTMALVRSPETDYVSVKITSIASRLDLWAYDASLQRIMDRLGQLCDAGQQAVPPTFVNLDMEEYEDVDLTIDAFKRTLEQRPGLEAGIVLQAYLPDTFIQLQSLVAWANDRHHRDGGRIRIRLVKGANLAMERVTAEMHGWPQAPYPSKADTDANFKRCVDWVLRPKRLAGVTIGIGSHNLFDIAWSLALARSRQVEDRVQIEMLQGMAPGHSEVVRADSGSMLLYTPVVAASDFDVAIGYLFRRLEENASEENFLHALFSLEPGSAVFRTQEQMFRRSVAARWEVAADPRRTQDRTTPRATALQAFANEPDTDPAVPANRAWAATVVATEPAPPVEPVTTSVANVERRIVEARRAAPQWAGLAAPERRARLYQVADNLAARRDDLISAMVHEASKTFAEADPEVSEAIDFARYYGDQALDQTLGENGRFTPFGVVAVVPPWNFPVAIPAGGVLAALAAGNAVIFKPAPETPRCAEIVAEACWKAGVPREILQFIRTPDDEAGRHLVTTVDAVILTGSWDTARLFQTWKPDIRLLAETSGKNAVVVTPHADLDLAAADLVRSAFGHSGQKCSAASLGILVGPVYGSERFRRQLVDAAEGMRVGYTGDPATVMGPVIRPVDGPLRRALTDDDAAWILPPRRLDDAGRLWSPGIMEGVRPGSWFHHTECFGPVLGLMAATDLDHAIELQNEPPYGLTGGLHSLDPHEIERWLEAVDIGNAYVNRHITGAIVRRQPFGGRKRSSIGPGAKAGGPNYVAQLGTWSSDHAPVRSRPAEGAEHALAERLAAGFTSEDAAWLSAVAADDRHVWESEFGRSHDPSGLQVESNVFRYQPRSTVIRAGDGAGAREVARSVLASHRVGVIPSVSTTRSTPWLEQAGVEVVVEEFGRLLERLPRWTRIRCLGSAVTPSQRLLALEAELDLQDAPVAASGRRELLWYLQEQSISRTLHRFGNLV